MLQRWSKFRKAGSTVHSVRDYESADEREWLLCRLLSFFDSDYYDDVKTAKTQFSNPSFSLVAENNGMITGLIDVEINGSAATIDSLAVHPSGQRQGIASSLLRHALARLPAEVKTLDAWTRETPSANRWYQAAGFRENYRYLHVYVDGDDPTDAFITPPGMSALQGGFLHSALENEAAMRGTYKRVYTCRQYMMDL